MSSVFTSQDLTTLIGMVGSVFFIVLLVLLILYLLTSFGLYRMAKRRSIAHAWLAWIPVVHLYILGELLDNHLWGVTGVKWILPCAAVIALWMSVLIPVNGTTYTLIYEIYMSVFYIYLICSYYKLYRLYSNHPVFYLVLTILFPFFSALFICLLSGRQVDRKQ